MRRSVGILRILLVVPLTIFALRCEAPGPPKEPRLPEGAEAISLLGKPLYPPEIPPDVLRERLDALRAARAAWDADPGSEEAAVWVGRRLAYLGQYREAVAVYTDALARHSRSAKLLRHRGHRFLTLRKFDAAVRDLEEAARLVRGTPDEVEPDGIPNARNEPTSTLQFNIHYHLGLARYLRGEFDGAAAAWRESLAVSRNPDSICAASAWLYLALRRSGREAEAARVLEPIEPDMDVIENGAYLRLLLLYRGEVDPDALLAEAARSGNAIDAATVAYGVGAWRLLHGDPDGALHLFRETASREPWAAFGTIAAEAEVARS